MGPFFILGRSMSKKTFYFCLTAVGMSCSCHCLPSFPFKFQNDLTWNVEQQWNLITSWDYSFQRWDWPLSSDTLHWEVWNTAFASRNTLKRRDINFLKQIQRETRVTQRADPVCSTEELFKDLEMLKLRRTDLERTGWLPAYTWGKNSAYPC